MQVCRRIILKQFKRSASKLAWRSISTQRWLINNAMSLRLALSKKSEKQLEYLFTISLRNRLIWRIYNIYFLCLHGFKVSQGTDGQTSVRHNKTFVSTQKIPKITMYSTNPLTLINPKPLEA